MSKKAEDIVSTIKWKINCGIYNHTNKLPSENAIAIKNNCSRLTARKALQQLKDEGLIISKKTIGYFVSPKYNKLQYTTKNGLYPILNKVYRIKDIGDKNLNEVFKEMEYDFGKFSNNAFAFIKIQKDACKNPFTILHSFLNLDLFNKVELSDVQNSLSAFFVISGIKTKKRIENVQIIKAPKFVQEKLKINEGDDVVATYSVMFNNENVIIEMAARYTILSEYSATFEREY